MMPCTVDSLDGKKLVIDLDNVIRVIQGMSLKHKNWIALIVYDPASKKFIELGDSPPDVRGNSKEAIEEVTLDYIEKAFGLDNRQLQIFLKAPLQWEYINLNNPAAADPKASANKKHRR